MRITLVVERFEAHAGGVENVVWNVARELVRAGDEVRVIARRGQQAPGIELEILRVPSFWQPLRVGSFARKTRQALARDRGDVVHAFSRTLDQDVFHAGGGSHADFLLQTHGRRGALARRLSPRHALLLALERRIFADPHQAIQCVSQMVRGEIKLRFGVPDARLHVIPCGVDPEPFAPDRNRAAREPLRKQIGTGEATAWLFAGSGFQRKGLDTAMRALASSREPRRELWVAGRDRIAPWRARAERLGVAQRVHFLGERSDMAQLLAAADGLILPTRYDAFGLVCLEACAAARPVVCSDRAGAGELLGDAGIIVPGAENVAGYADAMDRLGDARAREAFGHAGLEVAARHRWSHVVARLRDLYAGLVS